MQVKLYKVVCVTPGGARWFLKRDPHFDGISGDWIEYRLYSKEMINQSQTAVSREAAEHVMNEFLENHPRRMDAYNGRRRLHVKYERLTVSIAEFTAEV